MIVMYSSKARSARESSSQEGDPGETLDFVVSLSVLFAWSSSSSGALFLCSSSVRKDDEELRKGREEELKHQFNF